MQKATHKKMLIIGLGNPTEEYVHTYHNVGKNFLDYYLEKQGCITAPKTPSNKRFSQITCGGVLCVFPKTFMNESGGAVKEALSFYKINPANLLVIHDDSDMLVGTYKLVFDQRSAGHNGVESIINTIGTQAFWRLKIGIRPQKEVVRKKAEKFVLKSISKKDAPFFRKVFENASKDIEKLLEK